MTRKSELPERTPWTPGPWAYENVGEKENCIIVGTAWRYDDDDCTQVGGNLDRYDDEGNDLYYTEAICTLESGSLSAGGTLCGNARLITRAPALHDMLAKLAADECWQNTPSDLLREARALLAACRGETS